jgi:uncharacterized cupin superfamily protein
MNTTIFRASFCALVLGLAALGCTATEPLAEDEAVSETEQALNTNNIIVYEAGRRVPHNQLSPLDPDDFNAELLDCGVDWRGRIDLQEGSLIGGVLEATNGKYRQVYPGVFHATIIVGSLKAKTGGKTYNLQRGDSFLVTKGTEVVFETTGQMHQASFFGNFASPDMPGTFKVYKQGSTVPESELVNLGSPADFNMTVLEGNPSLDARIDYAVGLESAGHFRITNSKLFVDPTTVTEHGAVTKYGMTMTTLDGTEYTLHAGDAYLVRAGSTQTWEVNGPAVYQAFFGVFVP